MRGHRLAVVLAVVLGCAAGFLARRAQSVPPAIAPAPIEIVVAPEPATRCVAVAREYLANIGPLDEESESNTAMIAALADTIEKAGLAGPEGTPMEWPEKLATGFRPPDFSEAVARIVAECPQLHVDGIKVDCSEYPCSMMWISPVPISPRSEELIERCPTLSHLFGSVLELEAFPVVKRSTKYHFVYAAPLADDPESLAHYTDWVRNIRRRARLRIDENRVELTRDTLQAACETGDAEACVNLAVVLGKIGSTRSAEKYLSIACSLGDEEACEARP